MDTYTKREQQGQMQAHLELAILGAGHDQVVDGIPVNLEDNTVVGLPLLDLGGGGEWLDDENLAEGVDDGI